MSVSTAIGAVSVSLRNLLVGEMSLTPAVEVTVLAPDEHGNDRRINLFLYRVDENPYLRNQDWQLVAGTPSTLAPPPLSLNLFYLLTPYARNDTLTGNSPAHEILGEAMRVFYENPVVPAAYLETRLTDSHEELRIVPIALDPEELGRLWTTFAQPFRLSVRYQVSTVQLDQAASQQRPLKRVERIGRVAVEAPYTPPVVQAMSPTTAAAGGTLTFAGAGLVGWRAAVSIGERSVLQGHMLTIDNFQAAIPIDLQSGFHEVRVDISGLFRRTFLLEVTP